MDTYAEKHLGSAGDTEPNAETLKEINSFSELGIEGNGIRDESPESPVESSDLSPDDSSDFIRKTATDSTWSCVLTLAKF